MNLVELARYCNELHPGAVDATSILRGLQDSNLGDEENAIVAQRLIDMGARVEERVLSHMEERGADAELTTELLREYYETQIENIKEPGCD